MNAAGQGKPALKLDAFEAIQGDLIKLLDDSRELIKKSRINFEDAKLIAAYVTEMRVLLDTLSEVQARLNLHSASSDMYKLKEQVMELEGIVKEVRNSLEQSRVPNISNKKTV